MTRKFKRVNDADFEWAFLLFVVLFAFLLILFMWVDGVLFNMVGTFLCIFLACVLVLAAWDGHRIKSYWVEVDSETGERLDGK